MDEARRRTMLAWAEDGPLDETAARAFVEGNVGAPLDPRLDALTAGRFASAAGGPSPELMQGWFEDARTDLVRQWLAHPATMARIGWDAAANGGDGERKQGFDRLAAGEREGWEPAMGAAS